MSDNDSDACLDDSVETLLLNSSDPGNKVPTHPNLLAAPPIAWYDSIEEAAIQINNFAIAQGYSIAQLRTKTNKKSGLTRKVWFRCCNGGKETPQPAIRVRKRTRTQKTGCPFLITIKCVESRWVSEWSNTLHNHGPIPLQSIKKYKQQQKRQKQQQI